MRYLTRRLEDLVPPRLRRSETAALRAIYAEHWGADEQKAHVLNVLLQDTGSNRSLLKLGAPVARASARLEKTSLVLFVAHMDAGDEIEVADHKFQARTSMTEFLRVMSLGLRTAVSVARAERQTLAWILSDS